MYIIKIMSLPIRNVNRYHNIYILYLWVKKYYTIIIMMLEYEGIDLYERFK